MKRLKPYLRWLLVGTVLFFLLSTLRTHWHEVTLRMLHIEFKGYVFLGLATLVTLLAHIWAGWVWGWILADLRYPLSGRWSIAIYLKTNIAKYLPGNVWHFYGRILSTKAAGVPVFVAIVSVVLEPLLMAAAALLFALGSRLSLPIGNVGIVNLIGVLIGVLILIHPRFLNPILQRLSRAKMLSFITQSGDTNTLDDRKLDLLALQHYPARPLIGEIGFLLLRGTGFLITTHALHPIPIEQIPLLLSGFSFAWLLGLIVPGAPGGLGIFEATAILLLADHMLPGLVLSGVGLYRLISIIAETIGAGLTYLSDIVRA